MSQAQDLKLDTRSVCLSAPEAWSLVACAMMVWSGAIGPNRMQFTSTEKEVLVRLSFGLGDLFSGRPCVGACQGQAVRTWTVFTSDVPALTRSLRLVLDDYRDNMGFVHQVTGTLARGVTAEIIASLCSELEALVTSEQ